MYSADRWTGDLSGKHFTYSTLNDAELEIKFSDTRITGELKFDNWWVDKDTIDELIEVLQQVKLYMP